MEEGTFHTLFRLPEGAVLDQEGLDGSWLCVDMTVNGEIPCRTVESCCFVRDGIPYLEVIHDHVSLDDLDGISFQGVGGNIVQSEKISGNWEILFQVENMSVRELEPGRGLYSGELDLWGGCGSGTRGGAGDRRSLDSPNRSGRWCSAGRLEQTGTWTCFVQVPVFCALGRIRSASTQLRRARR